MSAVHFSKDGFETAISSGNLVMADFWASWCGPCRMLAPLIDSLADQYEGKAIVGKVNTEDEPELASRFGIMSIPTIIFFKNGQEIGREVGVMPAQSYTSVLDANL